MQVHFTAITFRGWDDIIQRENFESVPHVRLSNLCCDYSRGMLVKLSHAIGKALFLHTQRVDLGCILKSMANAINLLWLHIVRIRIKVGGGIEVGMLYQHRSWNKT